LQRKDEGEELSPERKGVAAAVCGSFTGGATAAFAVEIPIALNTRTSTPKIRLALDFISASIPLRIISIYVNGVCRQWKRAGPYGVLGGNAGMGTVVRRPPPSGVLGKS
jgi:hypothetical protein